MGASSPLSPVHGDHEYRSDMTPASVGTASTHRKEDVHIELTPRSERSFLPYAVASGPIPYESAPAEHGSKLGPSKEEPVNDAARAPADDALPPPSTPLKKIISADLSALQVEISPASLPLSYTANAFALAQPSTPPPASSARGDPEQKPETTEIPETPRVPELPGLSDIDEAPSELQTPTKMAPRSRAKPRKTSSPSAPNAGTANDEASDIAVTPTATDAERMGGSPSTTATGPRTTTRSGRQVVQPKSMRDSTPSPPSTKAKGKGYAKSKPPAKTEKTPNAAKTPQSAIRAGPHTVTPAAMRRRKAEAARWKTDPLLSSTRSPLINCDLRSILLRSDTWDVLSLEEQAEILALFPSMANVSDPGTDTARPNVASLINDNNFRHDCARYKNDLESGFFEREWLAEAFEAHMMRMQGAFDEYVVGDFEKAWSVTVPDSLRSAKCNSEPGDSSVKESKKQHTRDGEHDTVPHETPSSPTLSKTPAAIKQTEPTENPKDGAAITMDESGKTAANGVHAPAAATDIPDTKEIAAPDSLAAARDATAPAPISLILGSPLANEGEVGGQVVIDTEKPSTEAQPTSPETRDSLGKRKALTTRVQKGKRRKPPSEEASEADRDLKQGQKCSRQ